MYPALRCGINKWILTGVLVAVIAALPGVARADTGGAAGRIDRLEQEVAELRTAVAELRGEGAANSRLEELERRLGVLAEEVESLRVGETAFADRAERGLGMAASKVYRSKPGVSIGGYGEALYTAFDNRREDGSSSGATDTFDLLRTIFYFGYKFDERFVFNSEVEVEHASTEEDGAVSVEFAYVDWMARPSLNLRAGLVLVPMGFINELHEPTTFLGAARPDVERRIIPTTWREPGFGLYGEAGGWSYRTYLLTGLDAAHFTAGGIRGGRQQGSKARAEDLAWVGRLDYTGVAGLTLGGSLYTGGSDQGMVGADDRPIDVTTTIAELHGEWRWRGLRARLLAARSWVDDAGNLNDALGLTGVKGVAERMEGGYLELGYDLLAGRGGRSSLMPYLRWESFDTQAAMAQGFTADPANDADTLTAGVAFAPIEQLIIKADWQQRSNGAQTGVDRFSLALGYIF